MSSETAVQWGHPVYDPLGKRHPSPLLSPYRYYLRLGISDQASVTALVSITLLPQTGHSVGFGARFTRRDGPI